MVAVWRARDRLIVYLAGTTTATLAVISVAAVIWPLRWNPTTLAFVVLYALSEAHPVKVPHATRAESVVVSEAVVAMAALVLPPGQAAWVVIGGALLSVVAVRACSSYEQMRHATPDRQVLNFGKNVLGPAPLVAATALAAPRGLGAVSVAAAVGILVHGMVTHLLVQGAVRRASDDPPRRASRWTIVAESLPLAVLLVAVALPVGLRLRTHASEWPILLLLGFVVVLVSRARMGQDHAGLQAATAAEASQRFATARDVAELDEQLTTHLATVLRCRTVTLAVRDPRPVTDDAMVARVGDSGPWMVARGRLLGAPWGRLDSDLLRTVLAIAAPERRRLALLAEVQEAERFASLVLSAAGHDIGNRLQAAATATETVRTWQGRLSQEQQERLLAQADTALRQATTMLRDLVAVGASGLGASTSAADLALFTRALSPRLRVTADNVIIAVPMTVVQRALENLVRNAARHHRTDEPIEVAILADSDSTVRVEVRDRGPGLEPGMVETLFQPFRQLADDQGRRGSLGLGLFIARGMAESVGGSLTYRDRPGGGAVFAMLLPSGRQHDPERARERVVLGSHGDDGATPAPDDR